MLTVHVGSLKTFTFFFDPNRGLALRSSWRLMNIQPPLQRFRRRGVDLLEVRCPLAMTSARSCPRELSEPNSPTSVRGEEGSVRRSYTVERVSWMEVWRSSMLCWVAVMACA